MDENTAQLSERSARSEWKGIAVTAFWITVVTAGVSMWLAEYRWIVQLGKSIELHLEPMFVTIIVLGIVWTIRAVYGYGRSSDITPMEASEYQILRKINGEMGGLPQDRLLRLTVAALFATVAYALKSSPGAVESLKVTIMTFWIPLGLYCVAAMWLYELSLFCLALALIAGIALGISNLSVPLAIVVGAVLIAAAIMNRR